MAIDATKKPCLIIFTFYRNPAYHATSWLRRHGRHTRKRKGNNANNHHPRSQLRPHIEPDGRSADRQPPASRDNPQEAGKGLALIWHSYLSFISSPVQRCCALFRCVVLCWELGLGPRNLSQFDYGVISGRGCRVHLPPSLIPHTTTPNGTRNHALAISPTSALRMISPNPVRCFFWAPFSSFLSRPNRRMKWFLDEISLISVFVVETLFFG